MTMSAPAARSLVDRIEALLRAQEAREPGQSVDAETLLAAAGGDPDGLAGALWSLASGGRALLVGRHRNVLARLVPGRPAGADLLALLDALAGGGVPWFEQPPDRADGLAYAGWSAELEAILRAIVERGEAGPLLAATLPEPAGSSLRFALGRRGLIAAEAMPSGSLSRLARAFALRGSWCRDQFEGWERLWDTETFARAVWAEVGEVKEVGVWVSTLAPLVPFATPAQLLCTVDTLVWNEASRTIPWLAAHGEAIRPLLEARTAEAVSSLAAGRWVSSREGRVAGALAMIDEAAGRPWPAAWLPLALKLLRHGDDGLVPVLRVVDPAAREAALLALVDDEDAWRDRLWPLACFPSPAIVAGLVAAIRRTPPTDGWDYEREPLFEALGRQGPAGQAALRSLLDEPAQAQGALHGLAATPENARAALPFLDSPDRTAAARAQALVHDLADAELLALAEAHLDALPPAFAAAELARRHHLAAIVPLAARLPRTPETEPHLAWALLRPPALRPSEEALARARPEEIARWRARLDPFLDRRRSYEGTFEEALAGAGDDDLPAILGATASRMGGAWNEVEALARRFAHVPGLAWVAVFWWCNGNLQTLAAVERALGAAVVPPLLLRLDVDAIAPDARAFGLGLLRRHDPAAAVRHLVRAAGDVSLRPTVVEGLAAACADGVPAARAWIAEQLGGDTPEVALEVVIAQPDPAFAAPIEALARRRVPARVRSLVATARAKLAATQPPCARGPLRLPFVRLGTLDGPVTTVFASADGRTRGAAGAGSILLLRDGEVARLDGLGQVLCALSLDGRFVLVQEEFAVRVLAPWEGFREQAVLEPDDGLGLTVPAPGSRAFTLCAAHNAYTPLTAWGLLDGAEETHEIRNFPSALAITDGERYLVGGMNGDVDLRRLAGGKLVARLTGEEEGSDAGDMITWVGAADGGRIAAALSEAGVLRIWNLALRKPRLLARHARVATGGLAADPRTNLLASADPTSIEVWRDALPARALAGPGRLAVSPNELWQVALAFPRPGVLAAAGDGLDLWDVLAGRHLGRFEAPITALAAAGGACLAGDARGHLFRVG